MNSQENWKQLAHRCLLQTDYAGAAKLYERIIAVEPDCLSNYWYLGLTQLLQGEELAAQSTWFAALAEIEFLDDPEVQSELTTELISILQTEADRQQQLSNHGLAWLVRQHLREIAPDNLRNLLWLWYLSIGLGNLAISDLETWELLELLNLEKSQLDELEDFQPSNDFQQALQQAFLASLDYAPLYPVLPNLLEVCLPLLQDPESVMHQVLLSAVKLAYAEGQYDLAIAAIERCLEITSHPLNFLRELAPLYQRSGRYDLAIQTARQCCENSNSLLDKIFSHHLLIRSLMGGGGYWQEAMAIFEQQELLLAELIETNPKDLTRAIAQRLSVVSFFAPYLRDRPQENRQIHNQVARLCTTNLIDLNRDRFETYALENRKRKSTASVNRKLKIGYLSHCLNQHSVGWLARSLFHYHNRDRFELYAYFVAYKQTDDPLQSWYVEQVNKAYRAGVDGSQSSLETASRIHDDRIDILVDLDSLTLDINCETLALKPAPVQATWLGWDASGFPAIDYYIADPYTLPESAQDYYSEKIWRLPHTLIAVDGFEVGVPTLRREHLDIPIDAVIYLSTQGGYKRYPDTIRLQMQILKAVPNSYFLIKGLADREAIGYMFSQIAEAEGVDRDRLRFLPMQTTEAMHRANLAIADVVLDTYPYNGATTTLETLWMGIPIVTKVGEQFSARNSYSMMMNAGIEEGIAWTDAEYIDWGIRLGTNLQLRQQVAWKLRQSRHTSPLWNGQSFAQAMENAYEQMWEKYLSR
ncbi:O-linked N-acetylglucosamine transferase, SPINDLY family protein [Tumidithrix elongata RA019]|uniref:O-linked N-acetylglucosamine transferase, SPINDLY family protein n=1 Tax=Tumidithrix elongata BACA0141 TaxID=2716417 RepID=A0AAW9PW01_9CYAN|nr:O-linked N-acetylglucosamine transferase, SPINDLY family protein [Tumidithrix elongata RA019]